MQHASIEEHVKATKLQAEIRLGRALSSLWDETIIRNAFTGITTTGNKNCKPPIQTDLLQYLIINNHDGSLIHPSGLQINNFKIEGHLILRGVQNVPLLSFFNCEFDGNINLDYASMSALWLNGSKIQRLSALRTRFSGSVYLKRSDDERFESYCGVDFSGSFIGGTLSCRGATFRSNECQCEIRSGKSINGPGGKPPSCFRVAESTIQGSLQLGPKESERQYPKDEDGDGNTQEEMKDSVILDGCVSLRNTQVTVFMDDESTYFEQKQDPRKTVRLAGFTYKFLGGISPFNSEFRKGWLDMQPDDQQYGKPTGDTKGSGQPIKKPPRFSTQPYEQLCSVLRTMGHDDESDDIAILRQERSLLHKRATLEYRAAKLKHAQGGHPTSWSARSLAKVKAILCTVKKYVLDHPPISWLISWLTRVVARINAQLCRVEQGLFGHFGYGHKLLRGIPWALAVLALGMVIFGVAWRHGIMTPLAANVSQSAQWAYCDKLAYANDNARALEDAGLLDISDNPSYSYTKALKKCFQSEKTTDFLDYPQFNLFYYSVDTFMPIVSLGHSQYWAPSAGRKWGGFIRFYEFIHILAGWILTSIILAGLFRKFNRQSS